MIKKLKVELKKGLIDVFFNNIQIEHYVALFFVPTCRELSNIDVDKKTEVHNYLQNFTFKNIEPNNNQENSSPNNSIFARFNNINNFHNDTNVKDEIQTYLNESIVFNDIEHNLIDFWSQRKNRFSRLFEIFSKIISIPASSAAAERVFSLAGNIINIKRPNIDGDKVNNLVFLKSNFEDIKHLF
jgi:hypothetical protein